LDLSTANTSGVPKQKSLHIHISAYLHWHNNVEKFSHIVHLSNSGFLKHSMGNKRKISDPRSLVTVQGDAFSKGGHLF
jgi:hypothetical protein